jgi:hypothetical protein
VTIPTVAILVIYIVVEAKMKGAQWSGLICGILLMASTPPGGMVHQTATTGLEMVNSLVPKLGEAISSWL